MRSLTNLATLTRAGQRGMISGEATWAPAFLLYPGLCQVLASALPVGKLAEKLGATEQVMLTLTVAAQHGSLL